MLWAGFLEDLVLPLPAVMVCRGLTLPDPGRCERHSSWEVLVLIILHSSVFTPQSRAEESHSWLGKMFIYQVNNYALAGSVAAEELGWKSKLDVQTSEQEL